MSLNYRMYFGKFLDLDWTELPQIFLIVILFVISRIPLLNIGFGADPDAWRIANSAFNLKNSFYYETSRFPGYPLPEYINSLIIDHSWIATNSLTMLLSLISVIVFAKILNELKIKNKGLIVITYAFFPIIWIYSASTMDYMWALTFIIICWYFIIKNNFILAGLMMGLAIASRPTSIFLMIPFIYLIFRENNQPQNILSFLFTGLITSITLFLPIYQIHGLKFITFYQINSSINTILSTASDSFGSLAIIFGFILVIFNYNVIYNKIIKEHDKTFIFLFVSILSILIAFIIAPYEIAYLIPIIPFGIIFINLISQKKFFIIFCIFILLNSFININIMNPCEVIDEGLIKKDINYRNILLDISTKVINSQINNSVVISSEYLPFIYYLSGKSPKNLEKLKKENETLPKYEFYNSQKNILYLYLASEDEVDYLQDQGYKIYYIGEVTIKMTNNEFDYNLRENNCSDIMDIIQKI